MEMVFRLDCLLRVREVLFRGMIEWLGDGNEMMRMKWFIVSLFSIYFLYDEWFGNKIRSIIVLNLEKFDNTFVDEFNLIRLNE